MAVQYSEISRDITHARATRIHASMQRALVMLAQVLNDATGPWALMGSNAFLLHVDESIQVSDDIDIICNIVDVEFLLQRLGGMCSTLSHNTYPEGEIGIHGVLEVEGGEVDFELFAQNMDEALPPSGLVQLGFGEYVLEVHHFPDAGDVPVYALNPAGLIELYTRNFVEEFRNYEIADWHKKHKPKLKAARRLFNVLQLGGTLETFVKDVEVYDEKGGTVAEVVADLYAQFQESVKDDEKTLRAQLVSEGSIEADHADERAMVCVNATVTHDLHMLISRFTTYENSFHALEIEKHKKSNQTYDLSLLIELRHSLDTLRRDAFTLLGTITELEKKYTAYQEVIGVDEFYLSMALPRVHDFFMMPIETMLYARIIDVDLLLEMVFETMKGAAPRGTEYRSQLPEIDEGIFRKDYEKYFDFLEEHTQYVDRIKRELGKE